MTPAEIVALASERSIRLWVENGSLRFQAPRGVLTPELRTLLAGHKSSIIAYLDGATTTISGPHPLSYNQQFLWFLHQLEPRSPAYNVAFAARVVSTLDFDRIQTAFRTLVLRHPLLRATYHANGGAPSMTIHERPDAVCEQRAAAGWSDEALDREVQRVYSEPFDLGKGPVARLQLFTRSREDHVLLLTIHHIACDGRSVGILLKELSELYSAGSAAQLPSGGAPYMDFVRHQRGMLTRPEGELHGRYWKVQLGGELPNLNLPLDRQRPPARASHGATHFFSITGDLYHGIVSAARSAGATLYTFLLASFQILLMRYTSQQDILIGTPMTVRPRREDKYTVGCYINPVVLRCSVSADNTFEELLQRTRRTFADAFEHREYPFPLVVEALRLARDPSRTPIFEVMFNFLNRQTLGEVADLLYRDKTGAAAGESVRFGDLIMKPYPLAQEEGQLDLAVEMIDDNRCLTGLLKYNTDLFKEATIARMASHFTVLLSAIVSAPHHRLGDLQLLTPVEDQQFAAWNDTKTAYPDACIHELFEAQAKRTPDVVAVEFEGRRLTYAELDARSLRFAEHLRTLGIGPDELVACYVEPSLEMVIALLGILRAGGAYLPLDRMFPRERLAFMLEDAQPRVLVTLTRLSGEIPPHPVTIVCVDAFGPPAAPQAVVDHPGPRNLAYVLYTSGSTGKPKGVEIPHRAVVNFLGSMRKAPGMNEHDTLLSVTTISFDILGLELWLPLTTGAKVVLVPSEVVMDGKRLAQSMAECGATVMQATPATWRLLLEAGWEGTPGLKILCGGEAWSQELARPLLARCGSLWNMYGPTETTIWSAVSQVRDGEPVSLGRPIANTRFHVVDSRLHPVPVGVPGELLIGGDGLARGYRNRPALTAEKFIPDPFSPDPGVRLYRTGDLVRHLPDGRLEFVGRLDHQVKIRGFRIEPGDIETALSAAAGVRQALVMVREEEGEKRLVAYIVPDAGQAPSISALRQLMKEKLPAYMVPNSFVVLEKFPLTPNGKIDRRALPAAAGLRPELESGFLAPRTEMERTITAVWQDVLRVEAVGVHDNFFDLGGHSLGMARVHSRLREKLQRDFAMLDLFKHPTINALALFLSEGEYSKDSPIMGDDRVLKLKEGKNRMQRRMQQREMAGRQERRTQHDHAFNS